MFLRLLFLTAMVSFGALNSGYASGRPPGLPLLKPAPPSSSHDSDRPRRSRPHLERKGVAFPLVISVPLSRRRSSEESVSSGCMGTDSGSEDSMELSGELGNCRALEIFNHLMVDSSPGCSSDCSTPGRVRASSTTSADCLYVSFPAVEDSSSVQEVADVWYDTGLEDIQVNQEDFSALLKGDGTGSNQTHVYSKTYSFLNKRNSKVVRTNISKWMITGSRIIHVVPLGDETVILKFLHREDLKKFLKLLWNENF